MTSTVEKINSTLVEVQVELSQQEVNAAFDQTYARLGRSAQIRGFRKGKVPRAVLRRVFGKSLGQEILEEIIPRYLQKAIEEHHIEPIGQPEIKAGEVEENKGYGFSVKLELRPALEKIEYDGIVLSRQKVQVQQEDVDKEIARLRSAAAQIINLEKPRPAQTEDLVKVRLRHWRDGEWHDFTSREQSIVIGQSPLGGEFDEALVGVNVGDEKVIDLGSQDGLDKDRIRYMVNVLSIQGRKVPELDDEFAKDLGELKTLAELRESIESNIRMTMERTQEKRLMHELFKALREKNPMELPPGLVGRQAIAVQRNMEDFRAQIGGEELGTAEKEKLAEVYAAQARQMVHQHLLIREVARLEKLEVTDAEIDDLIDKMAAAQGIPAPMLRAEYGKNDAREQLRSELLERKMFDFALSRVKIIEEEASGKPTDRDDGRKESP